MAHNTGSTVRKILQTTLLAFSQSRHEGPDEGDCGTALGLDASVERLSRGRRIEGLTPAWWDRLSDHRPGPGL